MVSSNSSLAVGMLKGIGDESSRLDHAEIWYEQRRIYFQRTGMYVRNICFKIRLWEQKIIKIRFERNTCIIYFFIQLLFCAILGIDLIEFE